MVLNKMIIKKRRDKINYLDVNDISVINETLIIVQINEGNN